MQLKFGKMTLTLSLKKSLHYLKIKNIFIEIIILCHDDAE